MIISFIKYTQILPSVAARPGLVPAAWGSARAPCCSARSLTDWRPRRWARTAGAAVKSGDTKACMFVLRTCGQAHGYTGPDQESVSALAPSRHEQFCEHLLHSLSIL